MGYQTRRSQSRAVWKLVNLQHGVIARWQLLDLGVHPQAIKHRVKTGRLRPVHRGVYAVGRSELSDLGRWMAAVLACGPDAALSHESAAALWGFLKLRVRTSVVSVPANGPRGQRGIKVHRRSSLSAKDVTRRKRIPVTTVACTLIDLAPRLSEQDLEEAISKADNMSLTTPDRLLSVLKTSAPRPGTAVLRRTLTKHTFTLTDSELERRFIPIALQAGLPMPLTQRRVNGYRVDFYWPDLGLVVETDGIRYHRTAAQQVKDRRRDQAHTAAGLTNLRFTHWQVRFQPSHVEATLRPVGERLRGALPSHKNQAA